MEQVSNEFRQLTSKEQLDLLVQVHGFLSNFDRVPGSLTAQWSQVLQALAMVAKSVEMELKEESQN